MNRRLHSVLLTLWDIARDNPSYNRKLWGELQHLLSQLETRNNMLCALLSDLLHCTDDAGNVMWEEATIHSPPQGYAVKFMQEELMREKRPQMPKPPQAIPTNERGEAIDPAETRAVSRHPFKVRGNGGAYDPIDGPPPLPKRGPSARVPRPTTPPEVPQPPTTSSEAEEHLLDDLTVDYGALNPSPIGVGEVYDVGDESDEEDHLEFEMDLLGSDDTTA